LVKPYITKLPKDYKRLVQVSSLTDLFEVALQSPKDVNVIVWKRGQLAGNFNGLANHLRDLDDGVSFQDLEQIQSAKGIDRSIQLASSQILNDKKSVQDIAPFMKKPDIRREDPGYLSPSTFVFHADGGHWRLSCSYNEPVTEWVKNKDVFNIAGFHLVKPWAQTYRFEPGDIWLHSGEDNFMARSFIHRGRMSNKDQSRLIMIIDEGCYPNASRFNPLANK